MAPSSRDELLLTDYSHQKQALTFMVRREEGWSLKSDEDIWRLEEDEGCYKWVISKTFQPSRIYR